MPGKQGYRLLFSLFCCFVLMNNAQAARQSLTSITLQAEAFVADYPYTTAYPARFSLSTLDSRLNLTPCAEALDIHFNPPNKVSGNTALKIQCRKPVGWQIHLPVRIDLYDDVALASGPIIRGQTIDAASIQFRKHNITRLQQGYFTRRDSLERLQAKRNLAAETVLSTANVKPSHLVNSGEQVSIVLEINGLQVRSSGIALQSASYGQRIRVKNTRSSRIIEATVVAQGEVRIRL